MKKTVGQIIREARVKAGMTQKELAARIMRKEEGREEEKPITPQYLNDIEHDRRTPPEYIIRQIAKILNLDADHLVFLAGSVPQHLIPGITEEAVKEAVRLFRKAK
ncbi:MAG: XRE family transcriptional regulator [Acidobacteria bacterium]|nr:MAG: XRE family transcriptional regulator [Acidobacteriota bacterium]